MKLGDVVRVVIEGELTAIDDAERPGWLRVGVQNIYPKVPDVKSVEVVKEQLPTRTGTVLRTRDNEYVYLLTSKGWVGKSGDLIPDDDMRMYQEDGDLQ